MGRSNKYKDKTEHYTKMIRPFMETSAWRSLSASAQALYPWIKLEWKGAKANNNGKISLSVRQAAYKLGVTKVTAARAFHDLQAKGFLRVTEIASLGVYGQGKCFKYEITELPLAGKDVQSRLYNNWSEGNNFKIIKATGANRDGKNSKTLHKYNDSPVIKFRTIRANLS